MGMPTAKELSLFQETVELLFQLEEERIRVMCKELAQMPDGSLIIKPSTDRYYFDRYVCGKHEPITHDLDLVYKLARKRYLRYKVKEHELAYRRKKDGTIVILNPSPMAQKLRELLLKYKNANLDITRITMTPEQYHWVHSDYDRDEIQEGERYYETYSGVRMRSKSERDIGNELELEGIPYRYAQRIMVDVSWIEGVTGNVFDGNKYYYPDFMIKTMTGQVIVWEHLGRLDLLRYRNRNMEKFAALRQGKYCPEEFLILTVESDLEDGNFIRNLIARRIRPYV